MCRSQWFVPLHLYESHSKDLYERTCTVLEGVGKLAWLLQMLNTAISLFSPLLEEGGTAGQELLIKNELQIQHQESRICCIYLPRTRLEIISMRFILFLVTNAIR